MYTFQWTGIWYITLGIIRADCIGWYKSIYHRNTAITENVIDVYIYISKNYILFITEVLKAFSQLRYQFKLLGLANLKTLFVSIIVSIVERERADILGSQTVSSSMSLSHN
jgi:hypothetical protein